MAHNHDGQWNRENIIVTCISTTVNQMYLSKPE